MTETEFRDWIAYHRQCHPEWAQWSNDLSAESRRTLSDIWQAVLADIDLDAAQAVSRDMVTGKRQHPARWDYNQVARMVADAVADQQKQAKASQFTLDAKPHRDLTYICWHCRDSGWRPVYSRGFVAELLEAEGEAEIDKRQIRTANVACDCEFGRELASSQHLSDAQVYCRRNWCDAGFCPENAESLLLLKAWIEDLAVATVTDYEEFNAWNGRG